MIQKYKLGLLFIIIFLAAFLRLYQLGQIPVSPDWDEVALGYNAYSIAHTGRDEYGNFLPVVLRSFDDYKPALYSYLAIPTTEIFGLTVFATRLPSALFGILTVFITYLLIKELFKREELALLTSFLLAVSPWHIQFSRTAFETNVGLAFNVMTAYFFIRGLKRPWMLSLSAVTATLAIYTYQSEKVFTPLFVCALALIFLKDLLRLPKKFLTAAVIAGLIAIAPMAMYIVTNQNALMRAQATLAFSDTTNFLQNQVKRIEYDRTQNDIIGLIFDNRRVLYLLTGVSGYLSHYDLNWLFIRGDIDRHHAPGMGLLYLWELPFLFIGLYQLVMAKLPDHERKGKYLFLVWFLLAPVPAAFTSGVPHAVRTLNFLPTFQLFIAWGILAVLAFFVNYKERLKGYYQVLRRGIIIVFSLLFLFNFIYYLNQYFVQLNYFDSEEWQYGYQKAVEFIKPIEGKYRKIVVSDREPLDKSYMFFVFYLKYPPEKYQKEFQSTSGGFDSHQGYGKYEFRPINWNDEEKSSDILYVGRPENFGGGKTLKTINFLDGKPAIQIVEG